MIGIRNANLSETTMRLSIKLDSGKGTINPRIQFLIPRVPSILGVLYRIIIAGM